MALTLSVAVVGQLFKTGPFAWDGIFIAWIPTILFGIWFNIISPILIRTLRQQVAEQKGRTAAEVG